MQPDALPELLSAENRREAHDLGLKLAAEDPGGALVFGCAKSGRYEIAQHAASLLPVKRQHWVMMDVMTAPRSPAEFLRAMAYRIFKRLLPVAPKETPELLRAISEEQDLFLRQEMLKDALRDLRSVARPTLFFRNIDAVETTHQELDSTFEALRDILMEAGVYCFVTSFKDIRNNASGVSHFANNFTTQRPHPVTLKEIEDAWGENRWLPAGVAAQAMVEQYGFAELRVHQAIQMLGRLQQDSTNWAARLKASAHNDFFRDAEKFYGQLDPHSQRVLKKSVRGQESAPEHVQLLLNHDWARYLLRSVSEERVEIFDAPLRTHVEEQLLKESASRAAEPSARPLEAAARELREGSPTVALTLLRGSGLSSAPDERQRQSLKQLCAVARALDRVIHADYPQAIASLEEPGLVLDQEARSLLVFWRKLIDNRDMPTFYDRGTRSDILERLAFDLARATRRERLEHWVDAFKEYMIVVESAAQAVLAQRGWTKKQTVARSEWPPDVLEQYQSDRKQCGNKDPAPSELPTKFHGGLEALWLCRALKLSDLRTLRMKDLNALFSLRTEVNHHPGQVNQDEVVRAREQASHILSLTAEGWGLPLPEGIRFLWPESLVAAALAP